MNQFMLQQDKSTELQFFPHIIEFASRKIQTVQLHSLEIKKTEELKIYYVTEGKFDWMIDNLAYSLYPGDIALIRPGQYFGCEKGFFDLGTLWWISIEAAKSKAGGEIMLGKWSSVSATENHLIGRILSHNNKPVLPGFKTAGEIFHQLQKELFIQETGYRTRTNHLIDELLISVVRQLTRQDTKRKDFPQSFLQLEQMLRDNLSHQWTVEEMAVTMRLGISSFTEKVKNYTGFPPLNYLINIRISEAIKLLKRTDLTLTDIALGMGFYSSQHFSTTFKKITGYTPSQFKKNNKGIIKNEK
jgi:AraC-like DNA-binding protein/mannose-6-phosphate isomerase-like protein (cupin superfamily)